MASNYDRATRNRKRLNIGFVVHDENKQAHLSAPAFARGCHARKNDFDFGELTGPGIDLDRSGVLLDDNVVAQRQTKTGSFARWLGRKERVEYLVHHLGGNTAAIVANPISTRSPRFFVAAARVGS